jgi:hypothetical protein
VHILFNKVANSNKWKNSIGSLLIDGTLSTNWVKINEHIVQFYKKSAGGLCWMGSTLFLLVRLRLYVWSEFEEREVVKAMNGNKALGLNGYSMVFFQACCDVIKEDIMKVFCDLLEISLKGALMLHSLIPKIPGVVDPKDFRPIGLVSAFTKLLLRF